MTEDYLYWDGKDATELFGIGKYGSDSYEIFYKNKIPDNVHDKELRRYIREEMDDGSDQVGYRFNTYQK